VVTISGEDRGGLTLSGMRCPFKGKKGGKGGKEKEGRDRRRRKENYGKADSLGLRGSRF